MTSAVVTGAGGAIGSAIVRKLTERGIDVLAVDRDQTALAVFDDDDRVVVHTADVTDEADVQGYVAKAVELWGGVDMFANNAGIEGPVAPVHEYPTDAFDQVIAVNVRGVFLGLKHVLPVMSEGGSVVNTSSALGLVGGQGVGAYVTSKHAVIGLTKVAALENATRSVRVNAVCPGPIAGRMIESLEAAAFGDSGTTFADLTPMGRHGTADEVASFVRFLLSGESAYATGTAHSVDGAFVTG